MKANYQIMNENQKNENDKYVTDIEKLKQTATCAEEVEYIQKIMKWYEERKEKGFAFEFAFNMIYITKMSCGHYEVFQTPCNQYYSLNETLKEAKERAEKWKCTRCHCKW